MSHNKADRFLKRVGSKTPVLEKTKTSLLAPMEMASFCGGVHHKRYNEQRDEWF